MGNVLNSFERTRIAQRLHMANERQAKNMVVWQVPTKYLPHAEEAVNETRGVLLGHIGNFPQLSGEWILHLDFAAPLVKS